MLFKSRKDTLFIVVFALLFLLFGYIIYTVLTKEIVTNSDYIAIAIVCAVSIFILYSYTTTQYKISKTHFNYQCGFFKGTIELKNIHTIIKNKTMWVGMKPATAQNGLIIKYNKYDEIYISPKTNDTFITEILKYNPEINIQ